MHTLGRGPACHFRARVIYSLSRAAGWPWSTQTASCTDQRKKASHCSSTKHIRGTNDKSRR
ncbi:unnamed protein product [Laminaria digitata]